MHDERPACTARSHRIATRILTGDQPPYVHQPCSGCGLREQTRSCGKPVAHGDSGCGQAAEAARDRRLCAASRYRELSEARADQPDLCVTLADRAPCYASGLRGMTGQANLIRRLKAFARVTAWVKGFVARPVSWRAGIPRTGAQLPLGAGTPPPHGRGQGRSAGRPRVRRRR
jgi:hypothetical protein